MQWQCSQNPDGSRIINSGSNISPYLKKETSELFATQIAAPDKQAYMPYIRNMMEVHPETEYKNLSLRRIPTTNRSFTQVNLSAKSEFNIMHKMQLGDIYLAFVLRIYKVISGHSSQIMTFGSLKVFKVHDSM
jgi:hypothetical protein